MITCNRNIIDFMNIYLNWTYCYICNFLTLCILFGKCPFHLFTKLVFLYNIFFIDCKVSGTNMHIPEIIFQPIISPQSVSVRKYLSFTIGPNHFCCFSVKSHFTGHVTAVGNIFVVVIIYLKSLKYSIRVRNKSLH